MLLDKNKPLRPEKLLQVTPKTIDDVMSFSRNAEAFTRENGGSNGVCTRIGLCIEEMGVNIIKHGFSSERQQNHLSIRLFQEDSDWILRFRDDCKYFNPLKFIPENEDEISGIRLTMAIVKDADYTYSLNLNNLILRIPFSLIGEKKDDR